jgi:hypothetical protein
MSVWSHLTGVIRIDGMPGYGNEFYTKEKLAEFIGEPWTFHKMMDHAENYLKLHRTWKGYKSPLDTCKLPYGSEGSIDYNIHVYHEEGGFPWATVTFWGDLRDYEDITPLKEWVQNLLNALENNNYWVRQFAFDITGGINDDCISINSNNFEVKYEN